MLIDVERIHQGMVLTEDVFTREGNLLIPKNITVTDHLIRKLKEFRIERISIDDNSTYDVHIRDFDTIYMDTLVRIKDTFKSVRYKKVIEIPEFESIVDSIVDKSMTGRNVLAYIKMIGRKDEYTLQHSINVSITAMLFGKWMGYSASAIKKLGLAAILHDIGKVMISEDILNKPGKLTKDEYSVIKDHTRYGFQILKNSGIADEAIISVALTHHERIDGKGYPFGLMGANLSENAKIISICDVYDAITSERSYKIKQNPLQGLKMIFDSSYKGLDPYLCKLFLSNAINVYQGCGVVLSDGREGRILKISPEDPLNPWITVDERFIDLRMQKNLEIVDVI